MKKQPEVTARTKQQMIDAFWTLSLDENQAHITACRLAETAKVNRRTFYNHFIDMLDLQEQAENQFLDEYMNMINQQIIPRLPMTLDEFSQLCVRIFPIYSDKMYFLLGNFKSKSFENKVRERMAPFLAQFVNIDASTPDFQYLLNFIVSALRGFFVSWYEEGQTVPISELVPMIHKIIVYGLSGYKKEQIAL